jgi:dTDP-4-dehydrorhamnose 3,5-epimerase-like enzyme
MEIIHLSIPGLKLIKLKSIHDERGFFKEFYGFQKKAISNENNKFVLAEGVFDILGGYEHFKEYDSFNY